MICLQLIGREAGLDIDLDAALPEDFDGARAQSSEIRTLGMVGLHVE